MVSKNPQALLSPTLVLVTLYGFDLNVPNMLSGQIYICLVNLIQKAAFDQTLDLSQSEKKSYIMIKPKLAKAV